MNAGMVGAIVGSAVGILGGVIGTYASIVNTQGPRERQLMVRAAVVAWILLTAFVVLLFLLPNPYRWFLWIPYGLILPWAIVSLNRKQRVIRAEGEMARH